MILDLIGVTGWTLPQLAELTIPQLQQLSAGRGQILFPRLKPLLEERFSQYSSKPLKPGEESDIQRVLREHAEQEAARQANQEIKETPEQKDRRKAFRILFAEYLPKRADAQPQKLAASPIPGLPVATAQAIMQVASANLIPHDIWACDVAPNWLGILASAETPSQQTVQIPQ